MTRPLKMCGFRESDRIHARGRVVSCGGVQCALLEFGHGDPGLWSGVILI